MKKNKTLLLSLLAGMLVLTGCNSSTTSDDASSDLTDSLTDTTTDNTTTDDSTTDSSTGPSIVEEYAIIVKGSNVNYELSKTRAPKGEEITLKILSVDEGVKLTSVTMNGNPLSESEPNLYKFTMPNRTVSINFLTSFQGQFTIQGGVSALLVEESSGVYAARGVKVEGTGNVAISFVSTSGETSTRMGIQNFDETRSFANVSPAGGSSATQDLLIKAGNSYDFIYEPAKEYPCSIQRVSVDTLPTSGDALGELFTGKVRSEYAVYPDNLKNIYYKAKTTDNALKMGAGVVKNEIYEYTRYTNGSYAEIKDGMGDLDSVVYKNYDRDANLLTTVDTYVSTDKQYLRIDKYKDIYSARNDVLADDADLAVNGSERWDLTDRQATRDSILPYHEMVSLDFDMMYAYRVGVSPEWTDDLNKANVSVVSTRNEDTTFTTVVNTFREIEPQAGSSAVKHAEKFEVEITFLASGAVKEGTYKEFYYTSDQWDYSNSKPAQTVKAAKELTFEYTYGEITESIPNSIVESMDQYFISSFDEISFYNPETGEDSTDGNYLHYNDYVMLNRAFDNEKKYEGYRTVKYSPSTALDMWQYHPTSSSDTSVIAKKASNLYNAMTCVGVGEADVTFTNQTNSTGVRPTANINVVSTKTFHSISLVGPMYAPTGANVTPTSTATATLEAGVENNYIGVIVTPSDAAPVYDVLNLSPLITVTPMGNLVKVDTRNAASITEPTEISVKVTSDYWNTSSSTQSQIWKFTIIPTVVLGGTTWSNTDNGHLDLEFTDTAYTGTVGSGFTGLDVKTGVITDTYTHLSREYTDTYNFYYAYTNGVIKAKIYAIDVDGADFTAADCYIEIDAMLASNQLGLIVWAETRVYEGGDNDGIYVTPLIGEPSTEEEEGYSVVLAKQ